MTLTLRYMQTADVPQVVEIDKKSFDPAWSERSYKFEINESTYSHMVTLEYDAERAAPSWRRLVPALNGGQGESKQVVGYGGLWNIMDEAHVSTIATHPDFRGRGWGELLLAGMIRRSITLKAGYIVLEVRVSNHIAQHLYEKYGFQTQATKKHYYHNNGEDAYDMRLNLENRYYCAHFEERYTRLVEQHGLIDLYSDGTPPRQQR